MADGHNDILKKKPDDIPDLTPLYDLDSEEGVAKFEKFDATLVIDEEGYEGTIKIEIFNGTIFLHGKFQNITEKQIKDDVLENEEKTFLYINEILVRSADIHLTGVEFNNKNELEISWRNNSGAILVKDDIIVLTGKKIKRAKFHLFNFCDFDGEVRYKEKRKIINYVKLEFEDWVVHLASTKVTEDNIELLHSGTGHGLTHVGEISNKKGKHFTQENLENILDHLEIFFGFTRGRYCSIGFIQAYDAKGNILWERLNAPEHRGDFEAHNWFNDPDDKPKYEFLKQLFSNFMKISNSWKEGISEAVRWYHLSNSHHDIGTSIILAQTALELLAYQYIVKDKKLISHNGFKENNFKTFDKLQLFFSSLGIPLDIPTEVEDIKKVKSKAEQWKNSPEALTAVRNSFVHPHNKKKDYIDISDDISELGLWYLELSILAICGYNGKYYNRLSEKIEDIPLTGEIKELAETKEELKEVKKELNELKAKDIKPES